MPTFDRRTCARSHQPTPTHIADSTPSACRCFSDSLVAHLPWLCVLHRLRRCFAGMGARRPQMDEHCSKSFRSSPSRCAAVTTGRTRTPSAPPHLLLSDHVGSIHAHRHLRARSEAHWRLRHDGLRPGRRRSHSRRPCRPLLLPARSPERGEQRAPKADARARVCGHVRLLCGWMPSCCRRCVARASRPLITHDSPRPVCRAGAGHSAATAPSRGFDEGSEATGMMVMPRVADSGLPGTVP